MTARVPVYSAAVVTDYASVTTLATSNSFVIVWENLSTSASGATSNTMITCEPAAYCAGPRSRELGKPRNRNFPEAPPIHRIRDKDGQHVSRTCVDSACLPF